MMKGLKFVVVSAIFLFSLLTPTALFHGPL